VTIWPLRWLAGACRIGGQRRVYRKGEEMKCHFCDRYAPENFDELCDAGWIPSYWDGEDEIDGPVCGECRSARIRFDFEDSEFVLRDLYPLTMEGY